MNEEDRSRLEEFRQFWRGILGSKEDLLVGIDVAKDRHHAFFGTATGKTVLRRLVFENNLEGFRKLLAQAEAMIVGEGLKKVVFGMEPTGNYRKPFWGSIDPVWTWGRVSLRGGGARESQDPGWAVGHERYPDRC